MYNDNIATFHTIGNHIWEDLEDFLGKYSSVLIVGGNNSYNAVKDNLHGTLDKANLNYDYIYYGGECSWSNIDKIEKAACNYDVILGVGGGKAIDTAKAAAQMTGLDVITVPTISATCAATTALSVIYSDSGSFFQLFYLSKPPIKTFIDLTTLVKSPERYLKAGMGDTLAKFYEVKSLTQGRELNHSSSLGVDLSILCKDPILDFGISAYESNFSGKISQALKEVVTANIVTTGLVSNLIDEEFNGAIAHSVAMGLTIIDGFEEAVLHGEAVAYGILVQMLLEENNLEYNRLKEFYRKLNLPISLNQLPLENKIKIYKNEIINKIMTGPNVEVFSFLNQETLLKSMEL